MEETLKLSNNLFQLKLNYYEVAIKLSRHVDEIISKHMSSRPFHINVIEAACKGRFIETGHSLVLADLLKHPIIQSSFVENFLNIHHEYMAVTPERDRVDVALRGKNIYIIVENKVNAADEQENQVYRYVHEIGIKKMVLNYRRFTLCTLILIIVYFLQNFHYVTKIKKTMYLKHLERITIQCYHINMILQTGFVNYPLKTSLTYQVR